MNSTNNPFLWDKQCPSFLGPINTIQRENPLMSRKPNSFHDTTMTEPRAHSTPMCDICFLNVPQTYACTNCSKNSCHVCTQQWLVGQNIQCPNCHHSPRDSLNSEQEAFDICREHKTKVSYYCITCKVTTCSDCAMFSEKHKNHTFEKLDKAYGDQVSEMTREMDYLYKRLNKLKNSLATLDSNIAEVSKNKEMKLTELSIVTEQMSQRLGTELKSKLAIFIAQKGAINGEIEYLQRTQHNLNQQLTTWSKSHLLSKSDETLRCLQEINAKPCQADINKVSLSFVSEITPQFDTGIFVLKPFSALRQSTEVIYSEPLYCHGLKWRLKVYPDGNGSAKGEYLSIFLEMLEGLTSPSRYEYQVEMLNQRNPENVPVVREFVSEFVAGECWGYNRFYKINLLEVDGYLMPEQDTIMLKFSVRAQTYFQQCQDQTRYIEHLDEKRRQDEALIAELREKLEREIKEKESLLQQQLKKVEISEDLLNAGEIKRVSSEKEVAQEVLPGNIGSIEAIENDTQFNDLIHKIRGQKETSHKEETPKPKTDAFYSLLESNLADTNEERAKEAQDKSKERRTSTEDSQEETAPKEKTDICAQFEVLDPEECSVQDMSLYSSDDEYNEEEEVDVKHSVNELANVISIPNIEDEKHDDKHEEEFHEQISHRSSVSSRSEGLASIPEIKEDLTRSDIEREAQDRRYKFEKEYDPTILEGKNNIEDSWH